MKNPLNRFYLIATAVAFGFSLVPAALAATIYTTLGPGGAFDTNNSVQVDSFGTGPNTYADEFTSPVTATVGSVSLPLEYVSTGPHSPPFVDVSVWSSTANGPGTVLGSFVSGIPLPAGIIAIPSTTAFQLDAGTQYWLTVATMESQEDFLWYFNNQGIDNVTGSGVGGVSTVNGSGTAFAFELDTVPEPGSGALCAMTFAVAYFWRKRTVRC